MSGPEWIAQRSTEKLAEDHLIDERVKESYDAFVDDFFNEKPKGLPSSDDPWMDMELERARTYKEMILALREKGEI